VNTIVKKNVQKKWVERMNGKKWKIIVTFYFEREILTVLYVLDNFPHKTAFGFPLLFVHDTEESCCA